MEVPETLCNDIICSPIDEGWVKTPFLANTRKTVAPGPNAHFQHYPSGYISLIIIKTR